jgi:ribonucleotide monophosphatase NagD (HAD superfamily)
LVCTNPDLIGLDGERRIDAPGTVARRYAEAGGEVRYVGKPWPAIYRAALATMAMPGERIVAVGDSLEHDIEGAAGFGIDGALILDGIHAGTFAGAAGEADLLARLQDLLGGRGQAPRWLLRALRLGGGQPPVRR